MPFAKGQSGNPKGKPRGARDRRNLILDAIAEQTNCQSREEAELEWFKQLVRLAVESGDITAMSMITKRIAPELKQTDSPIHISLPRNKSLADQADSIIRQMALGKLTPQEALSVLQAVSVKAKIFETEDLEARITQLEKNQ